jgi:DNA replication protein DnaC
MSRLFVSRCHDFRCSFRQTTFKHAANLFFQLVSSRYEHASLILTSNLPGLAVMIARSPARELVARAAE